MAKMVYALTRFKKVAKSAAQKREDNKMANECIKISQEQYGTYLEDFYKGRLFAEDAVVKKYMRARSKTFMAVRDTVLLVIHKEDFELVRHLMMSFKIQQKEEKEHIRHMFPEIAKSKNKSLEPHFKAFIDDTILMVSCFLDSIL